jgi:hypothetical protein
LSNVSANVPKPFGEETLETIKQNYLNKQFLFIADNTNLSDYETIDLNNIYTVADVRMDIPDPETVDYTLVFTRGDSVKEQKYGQLYKNVQNVIFFEYKYIIVGDTTTLNNNEIEINFDRRNTTPIDRQRLFYRAYYPLEEFIIAYNKIKSDGPREYRTPSNYNINKLMALLMNPMSSGMFGQFQKDEEVNTSKALLSVIDFHQSNDQYIFLVGVNDNNVKKPFYIIADRMLQLIDLDYPNTIFEELRLKYVGTENYTLNGIPRETFVFIFSAN